MLRVKRGGGDKMGRGRGGEAGGGGTRRASRCVVIKAKKLSSVSESYMPCHAMRVVEGELRGVDMESY